MKSWVIAAVLSAALAPSASAQTSSTVNAARAAGQIGERYDGYLGVRTAVSVPVRKATESVNIRRRALYTGLAGRRGVSPQEVGITAGCSVLQRVETGEWYLLGDGVWRQRQQGQPAPVPDYCTGG